MNKKKVKITLCSNIIYYLFIWLHKITINKYGDDLIIQSIFYIALFFSTAMLEESIRKHLKEMRIQIFDFTLRIIVLIIHFASLYFLNLSVITNIITSILFIINIIIEVKILNNIRDKKVNREEVIESELKKFIENFYNGKLDAFNCGVKLNNEIKNIMKYLKISGEGNIKLIILFIGISISSYLYNLNKMIIIFLIVINLMILIWFLKSNSKFLMYFYKENKKVHLENILFSIGYIILFLCEVVFQGNIKYYMRVTIWVIAILNFLPMLSKKFIIKEELKRVYIKVNKL